MANPLDIKDAVMGRLMGACETPMCPRHHQSVQLAWNARFERFMCKPCLRKWEGEDRAAFITKRWKPVSYAKAGMA